MVAQGHKKTSLGMRLKASNVFERAQRGGTSFDKKNDSKRDVLQFKELA